MRKFAWLLPLFLLSVSLSGQRKADYGIFGGVSTYYGDINPGIFINTTRPAGGLFYRYNFNPRQALRANIYLGGLAAADSNSLNSYEIARGAWFKATIGEAALLYEFNFLPYSTQGKQWNYTPYIAGGAGIFFLSTETNLSRYTTAFRPVIPVTVGFKVNIYKNIGLEAEYSIHKTFYDNFDGLKNRDFTVRSEIHNNDWYSFAGVAVTWKFYSKLAGCPAFNDVDSGNKH